MDLKRFHRLKPVYYKLNIQNEEIKQLKTRDPTVQDRPHVTGEKAVNRT